MTTADEKDAPVSSLGERTVVAGQWKLASSVVKGVLQFGVSILLARILAPEEFGLVALALIAINLADMFLDMGLGPAMVQFRQLTERHVRVCFTTTVLVGLCMAGALAAAAPLLAVLMRNEAVTPVLRSLAALFVFSGLTATSRALLERRLDFRGLFLIDLTSYAAGYALVAVSMALLGFGVWSLVSGTLVQGVVACVVAHGVTRHPVRPLLAQGELRDLLGFGFGVTLNRAVVYLSYNGDNFVVGRWLGSYALGLYSRAFQLMMLPLSHLGSITVGVLFAAYSRLQTDRTRAASAYLRGIQLGSLLVAPVMAGMVAAGPHLVVGLYGTRWIGATVAMQVLCGVGLLRTVYGATSALTHAFGEVYAEFRRQAVYALLLVAAALAGKPWGITGVAVGAAAAVVFMYFAMAQLAVRITGARWRDFFGAQLPGVLVGVWVGGAALGVRLALEGRGADSTATLAAVVLTCILAVPAGLYLLPPGVRPNELFRSLSPAVARLPTAVRLPVRTVMRLPHDSVPAPS